jgi:transcriptional regulator of arginine metabolism
VNIIHQGEFKMSSDNIDFLILQLITNNEIHEQSRLQAFLKEKGHIIPQATISRKLKKLNIQKIGASYKKIEETQWQTPKIIGIKVAKPNLVVLHTDPGQANAVAIQIDKQYTLNPYIEGSMKKLIGTIAGDDTILLIIEEEKYIQDVIDILQEKFG